MVFLATLLAAAIAQAPTTVTYSVSVADPSEHTLPQTVTAFVGNAGKVHIALARYKDLELRLTPRLNADQTVTTSLEVEQGRWQDSKTESFTDIQTVFRCPQGRATLLFTNGPHGMLLNPPDSTKVRADEFKLILNVTAAGMPILETDFQPGPAVFYNLAIRTRNGETKPKLRTESGQLCTVEDNVYGHPLHIAIVPTVGSDGALTTNLTFKMSGGLSISAAFRGKSGEPVVYALTFDGDGASLKKVDPTARHALEIGETDVQVKGEILGTTSP